MYNQRYQVHFNAHIKRGLPVFVHSRNNQMTRKKTFKNAEFGFEVENFFNHIFDV